MVAVAWYVFVGGLLVVMALAGTVLKRLPLSAAMFYLACGYAIGPAGFQLLTIHPVHDAGFLERLTEIAVIVSLFGAGLKLRAPWSARRWLLPARLAFGSMALTVGLVTLVGVCGLGLPVGAAVLLGAVLAPTDPVLAADVQVSDPWDRDRLRFALTGEAGLNDGTAFPFVMLGLGLLGLHDLGPNWTRWLAVDVAWAITGGVLVGVVLGTLVGELVLYFRRHHKEAVGLDDFLALGLIALAYGVALLIHTYGFLAVFAAGAALRRVEVRATGDKPPEEVRAMTNQGTAEELAVHPEKAPAYMAEAALQFITQAERVAEVAVVVVLGTLLSSADFVGASLWFVPLLFVVIRPVAVWVGLLGSRTSGLQRRLMGWFGVRGVGSVYYLMYAITHGLAGPDADRLTHLTLAVLAASVVAHGISVTPLMDTYAKKTSRPPAQPGSDTGPTRG